MVTLEPITPATLEDALAIRVAATQEHLVRTVAVSLAEAYVHPGVAWPRLVVDDGLVVAFVMAFVDAVWEGDPADLRSGVWRLNVDQAFQGRGYGRFAVRAVCEELTTRGAGSCFVTFHAGAGSPGGFYRGLGFSDTGEVVGDQRVARLDLRDSSGQGAETSEAADR